MNAGMVVRRAAATLSGLLFSMLLSSHPTAVAACDSHSAWNGTASSCSREIAWTYDPQARTFNKSGLRIGSFDTAAGPKYEYEQSLRCGGDGLCGASAFTCPVVGGQRGLRYMARAYLLDGNGVRVAGAPPLVGTVCEYPGQSVPVAVVEAAAHEEIRKRVQAPTVTSAPPGVSLVNLLTIYATVPQPEPVIQITAPVPGEVRAVPEYAWDFGDGLTGLGPGLAYQPGDLPSTVPGKYLGATYLTAGVKQVRLTVTWRVQFRLDGLIDVPLAPIVFTGTEAKVVATARAALVNH